MPTLYVGPNGDDSAVGSAEVPLLTVTAAIARIRPLHRTGKLARIVLEPGTYTVTDTINLGQSDDGLSIVAQTAGTARLVGGRVLRTWTLPTPAEAQRFDPAALPHIQVCDLSRDEPIPDLGKMTRAGTGAERQIAGLELFTDGQPMTLARWPNSGWLQTGPSTHDHTIALNSDRPRGWQSTQDVWAMGYWQYDWAQSYEQVTAFDDDDQQITLNDALPYAVSPNRRFYMLNIMEELDSPGEWYLDRPSHRLFFWAPQGAGETIASTLNVPMFSLKNASKITLKGLNLEVGRSSAIQIQGGSLDQIAGCVIRDFGNSGVSIQGATNSGIVDCDLTGIGDTAITLSGGDRMTLTPGNLYADDNHIWNYSRWTRTYQPAVLLDGVGNRVTHNYIHDAPHNAILMNGNDHLIEGNNVRRVCQETGDSGAVYMGRNPTWRGTVIRGNRFRELGPTLTTSGASDGVTSVYLDDCLCGTLVQGNVFEGTGNGVKIGGGQDNVVDNNVFVGQSPAISFDARATTWASGYIVDPSQWNFLGLVAAVDGTGRRYSAKYPPMATYLIRNIRFPSGTGIVNNISTDGRWLDLDAAIKPTDYKHVGNVQFSGKTLAQALSSAPKGFKRINLNAIGLKTKNRPSGDYVDDNGSGGNGP